MIFILCINIVTVCYICLLREFWRFLSFRSEPQLKRGLATSTGRCKNRVLIVLPRLHEVDILHTAHSPELIFHIMKSTDHTSVLLSVERVPHFVAKFPTESPMPFRSFFVSLFVIEQKSQMH